jgi:hypothetical protein
MQLQHSARPPEMVPVRRRRISAAAKPAGRFGLHLVEMCAVMCVGGGLLIALFFGAVAFLGFTDLRQQAPELSALVISIILAGTMVAWMRFRRMEWRPTLEMAGSSIAAGVLLIAGYRLDIVPESALVPAVCGLACVAMVAVMLFRVPLYSSSHTGHRRHSG